MVLLVHGGPWARDSWGFNPQAQWLANRGYAVLQVNFRGSTGYGKKFLQRRQQAVGQEDARRPARRRATGRSSRAIADPKKVAIFGGSYGGYAALAGATFTPDVFACAVDIVGPSNLMTLIDVDPAVLEADARAVRRRAWATSTTRRTRS